MRAKSLQSCLFVTPWTVPRPGSSVRGILQARILEWVAICSSEDLSDQGSNPHLLRLLHRRAGSLLLVPPGSQEGDALLKLCLWDEDTQNVLVCSDWGKRQFSLSEGRRRCEQNLWNSFISWAMAKGYMTSAPYRKTQVSGPGVFRDKVRAAHSAVFVRSWESLMGPDDKLSCLHSAPCKPQG